MKADKFVFSSWDFVISHGILPILPLNSIKFMPLSRHSDVNHDLKQSQHFLTISAKHRKCKVLT